MFDVSPQGSLLETHCPRFLLGSGHIGTLCLTPTEIPDSRRKTTVQHKSYCLQKQSRYSEPPLPVWGSLFLFWGKKSIYWSNFTLLLKSLTGSRLIKLALNVKMSLNCNWKQSRHQNVMPISATNYFA